MDAIDPGLTLKGLAILHAEVAGGQPLRTDPMTGRLEGRLIGLGVCGSIAAYKAVELLRLLRAEGADVVVMLTPAAATFVGPLTFGALSRHAVETDVLGLLPDQRIGHIVVADAADVIVVAPATARWLGSMANGIANDAVTAACLATAAPVVFAPAMDGDMWTHRATRDNVERLQRDFGYRMVPPEIGSLASGQEGIGRLADLPLIVDAIVGTVAGRPVRQPDPAVRPPLAATPRDQDLAGRRIVVSAGGTAEAIDPVRFIGNRSTGKMGVAIAEAALARGAQVTIVAGRVEVPLPEAAQVVHAESTAAMRDAVVEAVVEQPCDALVMAAAVADFRPAAASQTKLARGEGMTIRLEPTGGHPRRGRGPGQRACAAPGPRRICGRDRVARPRAGEAAPEGRRPARGQRRERGRFRLRNRYEPSRHPRRRRVPRRPATDGEAGGRGPPAGPGRRAVGRTRCPGAHWRDPHGESG